MLTSIIVHTQSQASLLRQGLESLREHTTGPYELIVVDNASTDDTTEVVRAAAPDHAIRLDAPASLAACVNLGLEASRGERLVVLDEAVTLSPGWLDGLLQGLEADERVAAVGPVTNLALVNLDQIVTPDYDDVPSLHGFARERSARLRGSSEVVRALDLFCIALRRDAVERIGPLDSNLTFFAAQDYGLRTRLHRLQQRLLHDVFVHRQGMRLSGPEHRHDPEGSSFQAEMERDQARYSAKWEFLENRLPMS